MRLSRKNWNNYVTRLSAINKTAGRKMEAYIAKHGTDDVEALVEYAYALTTRYGEAASAVACEMYDEVATVQKANVPPAVPKQPQNVRYVDAAVRGALGRAPATVPSTVSELVKRTGAETTLKNAKRDGAYFAWVPNGDTCAFCITLASNGWRRASKKTINGDHAEHIHKNCNCEFAISFNGPGQIEGYDPDKYLAMYEGAEGSSWKDKVNAMRRANYATNKDAINAQKRAAYAARKVRDIVANGKVSDIIMTRLDDEGKIVVNPMTKQEYDVLVKGLQKHGIVVEQAKGDELVYYQYLGAEAVYAHKRILHIGELPSRAAMFEEIIHYTQARLYGELDEIGTPERAAREIVANRMLIKYKEAYRIDDLDNEVNKNNLKFWEKEFERLAGVPYDRSNINREI